MDAKVWVEDRKWRTPSWYAHCRSPGCRRIPVADLRRRDKRAGYRWWAYCADHLYGRRVQDGKVLTAVQPESEAARRGWVEI